jgi:hypothetical protein
MIQLYGKKDGADMKLFVAILAGAALGVIGSRYLFVGSWLSLVPWGIVGLALGLWEPRPRPALLNGALYGFALAFAFLIAGYSGSASLLSRLPFFALLALFGAFCGAALGWVGSWVRRSAIGRRA